jgi:hypothetical protein
MNPTEEAINDYIDTAIANMERWHERTGWWFHIVGVAVLDCDPYPMQIAG